MDEKLEPKKAVLIMVRLELCTLSANLKKAKEEPGKDRTVYTCIKLQGAKRRGTAGRMRARPSLHRGVPLSRCRTNCAYAVYI